MKLPHLAPPLPRGAEARIRPDTSAAIRPSATTRIYLCPRPWGQCNGEATTARDFIQSLPAANTGRRDQAAASAYDDLAYGDALNAICTVTYDEANNNQLTSVRCAYGPGDNAPQRPYYP